MIDENGVIGTPKTETVPHNDLKASPKETLVMQLQLMMKDAKDEERCILCKAAEELNKPENSGIGWAFPFLFLMLTGWSGDGLDIDPDGMKAYMDAIDKKRKKEG